MIRATKSQYDTANLSDKIIPKEVFDCIINAINGPRGVEDKNLCLYEGMNSEAYFDAVRLLVLNFSLISPFQRYLLYYKNN